MFLSCPARSTFADLSGEGRGVFPGQPEEADFLGCWLVRARCLKSGGDDDAAELGGHVGGGGLGLAGVPRGERASLSTAKITHRKRTSTTPWVCIAHGSRRR